MSRFDKLKSLQNVCGTNYWSHRIYAELCYMECLSSVNDNVYDARIEEALDYLTEQLAENHAIVKGDALHVEEMLADLSPAAKALKVYCISHAHIDMNWMWGYQETAAVTVDTFRTVLNLMKEYPDFTFAQSQASTYKIIEENAPEMLDEIKKYVHEGRWEITASTWVETDKNMPNGESLSRHILYTKRYLAKLFDIDPDSLRIDFEPDTFGHNANVPEICQNGGVDYYYHCRGNDDSPDVYRWRSKSGREILVHRDPHWYNGDVAIRSFESLPLFCKKNRTNTFLHVYGVGDHGGGPSRNDIERIADTANFPLYPVVEFGTFAKYFAALEENRENFPVIERELNFVFTGCYTSQSRIKMANRISEDRSYDSEFLSAAAQALVSAPSKTGLYQKAWEKTLFNHFHDILPGSGVIETREYALGQFQQALAVINTNANTAMRDIADAINTDSVPFEEAAFTTAEGGGVGFAVSHESGYRFPQTERGRGKVRAIHLFNTTMYDRAEAVEVTVWDYNYDLGRAYITDADGNTVQSEVIQSGAGYWGHRFVKLLVDAKIPAFGYSTYILRMREYDNIGTIASTAVDGRSDYICDSPCVLENTQIKAVFDPYTLAMTEFTDKVTGETIVTPERPSAMFRFIKENPRHGMTSWRVGPYMKIDDLNSSDYTVCLQDYGITGMRRYLKYEVRFSSSVLTVTAELRGESRIINFHIDVDWQERGNGNGIQQLNFYLPVNYTAGKYTYDIPLGTIDRADIAHDVPAGSFMRIAKDGDSSAFIVTDTKYGFRGHDNAGAVTLIRSSYDPDPYPELGRHHINLGVGICAPEDQKRLAVEYCHPISFNAGVKHTGGTLPMNGSVARLEGDLADTMMVSAVKSAEDGGIIVRTAEFGGREGKAVLKLSALVPMPTSAKLVDITELHELGECRVNGREIEINVKPYSMATVLIK